MKLAISNIAWNKEDDRAVYDIMRKYGYTGLEIAPTRIFETAPYGNIDRVKQWREEFSKKTGFIIPSMQSIWFGKTEKLFADDMQRQALFDYTKSAIAFANAAECGNLVFGSPKNRVMPDISDKELWKCGVKFFKELGDCAFNNNTAIGMEANPKIYNTNYINTTNEAIQLIKEAESEGFLLNLDIGTMLENKESADVLTGNEKLINHVHVSEPFLKPVLMNSDRRQLHTEIAAFLRESNYQGYVSVEMGKIDEPCSRLSMLDEIMAYVKEIFE